MKRLYRKIKKIKKQKKSIHERTVSDLENRLLFDNFDYSRIITHKEYCFGNFNQSHLDGEIDVLAMKGKYRLVFEVKSTNHPKSYCKARKQLERARRLYENEGFRVFTFYVTPKQMRWLK